MPMMAVWMGLWAAIGLGLLLLITLAIIWLIRQLAAGPSGGRDLADEELRRRYAAGQINRDEYLRRRADIRRH